jgi:hypothetical protein
VDARDWVQNLAVAIRDRANALEARVQGFFAASVGHIVRDLAARASRAEQLTTAQGHGDFQPGNILLRPAGDVLLIDWEYADRRWVWYDFLVFALQARSAKGLGRRIRALDRCAFASRVPSTLFHHRSELEAPTAIATFLLEELLWSLDDEVATGLPKLSERFRTVVDELAIAARREDTR